MLTATVRDARDPHVMLSHGLAGTRLTRRRPCDQPCFHPPWVDRKAQKMLPRGSQVGHSRRAPLAGGGQPPRPTGASLTAFPRSGSRVPGHLPCSERLTRLA